ncbi:hypothetical protein HPT25_23515 [Bacillus sp. BRMEA1]|uniref:hypothetical protein n=1 Tax=Neobacillus endophyticus TaxID=2738405 RepID=UPI001562ED05|nr:hypothetical protein [Neobacillus endophyticus]NRD80294.1 hypothetical protein [Neobacillus endophyticus]
MERLEGLFAYFHLLNGVMVQMDTEAALTKRKMRVCEEIEKELGMFSPDTITVNINNQSGKTTEEFIEDRIKYLLHQSIKRPMPKVCMDSGK